MLEGHAALIGCLLGLNQLPAGCRVDNSGITGRQSPWVHKRRRDVVPFSLFKNTGLCARAPLASLQPRGAYQTGTPRGRLAASFCHFSLFVSFFGFHLHLCPSSLLPRPSLSHRRGETCLAGVPAGSVERDPARNKTSVGTSPCNGVQIASQARSLLRRGFAVCDGGISLCGYCEL